MQQHNQVFVIQVSSGAAASKPPLALPPAGTDPAVLPSEVKYSASLVRGLGLAHLFLGSVIFLLGVLGTWIEPETCWAGAGVWTGLSALLCGLSGVVAHCFWYKNFSIKAFLVTSVVCVVLSVLAIVLSIYAIVNRHKHFQTLLDQMDEHSWFQPYDLNREHRLTLNISANLLVGFFLELGLALWSSRVGWRGVQSPEFSASNTKRDVDAVDQRSVTPLPPRPGQQVPLAALYQLLQAHPEMLGNKSVEAGLVPPWMSGGLGDHPTHHSMDYQERVNRFLSHAIEDQNPCLSRPLSALLSETRDSASTSTSSGGRCSPADTLPMPPPDQPAGGGQRRETMEREMQERYASSERKMKQTHVDKLPNGHPSNERKGKETHVDTLSNADTSSERKMKQTHIDRLPNGQPSSKRKVKETHVDTLSSGDSGSMKKIKETRVDKLSNGHISSNKKEKVTHVDTLSNRDSSSERKVKVTHVDTLSNRDSSSERKVKVTHVDTLSNGDTGSMKKLKTVDTLSIGDTGSIKKAKETHVDTFRTRRGSEHKPKAPVPVVKRSESLRSSEVSNKGSVKDEPTNNVEVPAEKCRKEKKSEVESENSSVAMEAVAEKSCKGEKKEYRVKPLLCPLRMLPLKKVPNRIRMKCKIIFLP
ncbi:uncharacterized protein LOC123515366 isoform X2 [Portunus trituberculatus]|nr:uncharacterized protein LOC123515366 isoform X2 [Portunus trituberculatus]